jgi:cytochrome c oxidase assembly protein subunit 11
MNISHIVWDFITEIDVIYYFSIATDTFIDVKFISRVSNFTLLEFLSLQKSIIVHSGESTLAFFRIYNPTFFDITGISMYYIFPINAAIHVNKVQCFCFDLFTVSSLESVELPILFYVSDICSLRSIGISSFIISYVFFIN